MTVIDRFETNVRTMSDTHAIYYGDRTITFGELNRRANRFANLLEDHGVKVGDRVSLLFTNMPTFVVTYLGAMKRGAIPFPINTRFEGKEIRSVIDEGGASVHVQSDEFDGSLEYVINSETVDAVFTTDSDPVRSEAIPFEQAMQSYAPTYRSVERCLEDTADLMFTSGTTGRSKGVVHTYRNVLAVTTGLTSRFELTRNDRLLVLSPVFHVSGGKLMLASLAIGCPMILLDGWSVERFLSTIERHRATFTHLITTVAVDIAKTDPKTLNQYDTSSFRVALVGGGSASERMFSTFEEHVGGVLCEGYGLTESEGCVSFNPPGERRKLGSNGLPHRSWCDVKIVDPETREERASGESGEILIKGDVVAPRYYDRPDLTESAFEDGWLSTGDLGHRDREGYMYFSGRLDDQIKTGGENVYPAEVESVLLQMDEISDIAVVGTPDERWGEKIRAAVIRQSESLSGDDIVAFCRASDSLANFKRPREITFVDSIPQLETQKVDREAVRKLLE